ncbi:MAG: type transport system permease protein [Kribbellaceae bacterium]|nr:type transport system permease protein [Kribbellaceae bacterium]
MALGLTYATSETLVRMRLAAFRHALRDQNRAASIGGGGLLGLVLAGGTVWAAAKGDTDLVAVAVAVWMLGWIVGPLFAGGGDETLKPEYFTMLPLPPRTLSGGLLAAALAGVAPLVSLVALLCLVVVGSQLSVGAALVALPAVVLQLLSFVLASRLAVAVYGVLLQVRAGAMLAAVVNAFILAFTAQGWALVAAFVSTDVQGTMARAALIAPSGWGLAAVEAAGRGDWLKALLPLVGLAVLSAAMFAAWSALLVRRTTATRAGVRPRRPLAAGNARTASQAKEIRSWTRDLLYGHRAVFAICYGLFFCLMPLAIGWKAMLPWAGGAAVVMGGAMFANLYGADGTAYWLTLMTPGSARLDIRARQRAFLVVFGPPALVLTGLLTWWSGEDVWPLVLSLVPAVLGGAAGLIVLSSVYAAVPTTDAHKRSGNPLNSGENDGETIGLVYVMLVLISLTAAPALLAALAWSWWGVPVGLASAVLTWWYFGKLAAARLEQRGPELLTLLRHGRSTAQQAGKTSSIQQLPKWRRTLAGLCLGFGAIPLFPQAVVPAIFKLNGVDAKAWFLALYVTPGLQWLVIAGMAALGLGMYAYGGLTYWNAKRPSAEPDTGE